MANLGKAVVFFFCIIPTYFFNGYVLMKLWEWFVTPTFGLHPLKFVPAMGLSLVVGYLTVNPITKDSYEDRKDMSEWEKMGRYLFRFAFLALVCLSTGWILHLFM